MNRQPRGSSLRRHGPAGRAGAALVIVAALLIGGCTSGSSVSQHPQWASGVEEYLSAWAAAEKVGFTSSAPFYTPDTHQDFRAFNDFEGAGRAAIVQNLRDSMQLPPRFVGGFDQADAAGSGQAQDEPPYLSLDSVVLVTHSIDWQGVSAAGVDRVSAQGVIDQTGLFTATTASSFFTIPTEQLLPGARRFIGAWAGGDPAEIGALYADAATLDDQLLGLHVSGASEVAMLAAQPPESGGLGPARLHELPGEAGPAVYVNGDFDELLGGQPAVDELLLLLDVTPDGACPGPVAVLLALDSSGRIVHEERFHRIDALRRCLPEDERPSGWWELVHLPALPAVPRTGSVPAGRGAEHDIAVWNGDAGITPIITWARQRFADTGLPPPTPSSMTFLPEVPGDPWATYGFLTGSDAPDIGVPVTRDSACSDLACRTWTPAAKSAMLHELAHAWVRTTQYRGLPSTKASGARARAFLAAHDLAWHDPALPWGEQGTERAAETIAWGLMDEPYTVDTRLGPLTCEELAADFEQLTYSTPDPRACAEPAAAPTASAAAGGAP